MDGSDFEPQQSRFAGKGTVFYEKPAVVISTLVLSAVVCATSLTVVLASIPAFQRGQSPAVTAVEAALGTGPGVEAPPTIAATEDGRGRFTRDRPLFPAAPDRGETVAATPPAMNAAEPRIIAGRPPVMPLPRPDRAAGEATPLLALRPVPRPAEIALAAATAPDTGIAAESETESEAPEISILAVASSRFPALRPADLDTGPVIQVARADPTEILGPEPAPAVAEPLAGLRLGGSDPCNSRLAGEIPRRSRSAPDGSVFLAGLTGVGGGTRDRMIADQVLAGNVPDFLRELQPVTFSGLAGGSRAEITICVTPDYLALGSDRDSVRVPLGLPTAGRIADGFDMMLPTTRMVDAIYSQADLRLSPQPMTPGSQMSSTSYFMRHDTMVEDQRRGAGGRQGMLVAGHKKDIVLTNRLASAPGRVAIYGWHRQNGNPIQPLSTVHGGSYADYSHGVRLVSRTAYVNGRAFDLRDLLSDSRYAGLLNSEGPISGPAIRLASLSTN